MTNFICSEGYLNCPKCGGWQILDKTKRNTNGWPIGGCNYVDCDHCKGKGEVVDPAYIATANKIVWVIPPVAEVVTLDTEVKMPDIGWV